MKKFIEFDNLNSTNQFEYNIINTNIDNIQVQEEYNAKFDCLFNTMIENKKRKVGSNYNNLLTLIPTKLGLLLLYKYIQNC